MKKTFLNKLLNKSITDTNLLNSINGGDDDTGDVDKKKIKIPSNGDSPDEVTDGE